MRALTWHGKRDVRVEDVPDPKIEEPTDAVVRVTTTGLCGSDLHLYEVMGPFLDPGDVLGHEPMGIVEEVGSAVTALGPRHPPPAHRRGPARRRVVPHPGRAPRGGAAGVQGLPGEGGRDGEGAVQALNTTGSSAGVQSAMQP